MASAKCKVAPLYKRSYLDRWLTSGLDGRLVQRVCDLNLFARPANALS